MDYKTGNEGHFMGYTLKLKCCDCNYEKILDLGNGRKDFDINTVAKKFKDQEILDIILNSEKNWLFSWKLAQCRGCKGVFRIPTVVSLDEQELVEAICECGSKDILIINEGDEQTISCKCKGTYIVENIGLWD